MASLNKRLRGYVLVESVISMVIIMLCFGISFLVFDAMTEHQRNYLRVRAEIVLKTEAARCKMEEDYFDEDIVREDFRIEKRIRQNEENERIATLELKAITEDGKTVSEYYELVFVK